MNTNGILNKSEEIFISRFETSSSLRSILLTMANIVRPIAIDITYGNNLSRKYFKFFLIVRNIYSTISSIKYHFLKTIFYIIKLKNFQVYMMPLFYLRLFLFYLNLFHQALSLQQQMMTVFRPEILLVILFLFLNCLQIFL